MTIDAISETELVSIGRFKNETDAPLVLYLEMLCAEVHLSPGHEVELLARQMPELQPVTVSVAVGSLTVVPHRLCDPRWHVRFNGKLIEAGWPTVLADHVQRAAAVTPPTPDTTR